jgi:hypothetical protein
MRNSDADVSGPPIPDNESEGSDVSDIDIKPDSEGWEDLEEDTEEVAIQCLLCDQKFAKVQTMVKDHCKASHNFDLLEVRQKLGMYMIQFVEQYSGSFRERFGLLRHHQTRQLYPIRSPFWSFCSRCV